MSFIAANINSMVQAVGPRDAKIVLVGEAPGAEEARQGKPFVGPSGTVLEQCLHAAGLTRAECYITNVVKQRPPKNDISPYFKAGTQGRHSWTIDGWACVEALREELADLKPNIIVTLGAVATAAVTNTSKVMKYRGYVLEGWNGCKVIPTIHPAASLRGQYIYRYVISYDLKKAREESNHPEIVRPHRDLIYSYSSVGEALEWIEQCGRSDKLSLDIEVLNYELAIIGLAPSPTLGVAIPLAYPSWTLDEEVKIWRALAQVIGNDKITNIMQNGIFDIHFLASKCGIKVRGPLEDTMMAHSLTYPDLRKGLDFLGSIYCGSQEYWKDMVDWDNIKEDS